MLTLGYRKYFLPLALPFNSGEVDVIKLFFKRTVIEMQVFADHDSSLNPIDVPRSWLWNLPRRTVYFGTSIPTIFKGKTKDKFSLHNISVSSIQRILTIPHFYMTTFIYQAWQQKVFNIVSGEVCRDINPHSHTFQFVPLISHTGLSKKNQSHWLPKDEQKKKSGIGLGHKRKPIFLCKIY